MSLVSDVLYLLSVFSLRAQFVKKALVYGQVGTHMFPGDVRHFETYAYALLLDGQRDEAADILATAPAPTKNISFLHARLALVEAHEDGGRQPIKEYLRTKVSA